MPGMVNLFESMCQQKTKNTSIFMYQINVISAAEWSMTAVLYQEYNVKNNASHELLVKIIDKTLKKDFFHILACETCQANLPSKFVSRATLRTRAIGLPSLNYSLKDWQSVASPEGGGKTIQVQPELLIVNTHELLIVGILNRILFGTKIIYDIQENYWRNILLTNAFYKPLKPLLAGWVRLKEMSLLPFYHGALLAEKGYERELKSILKKNISSFKIKSGFQKI